jgi:hypothetical protein
MQPFLRRNVFKVGQDSKFSKTKKMKLKLFYLAMFGLFLIQIPESSAQGLVIKLKDGSTNIENLNAIQKLSFSETDLLETLNSGTVNSFAVSSIQKLYFDMTISIEDHATSETAGLKFYPNPAQETLNIQDIPNQAEFIFIYRSDGKLVITEPVTSGKVCLNISKLTHGLYFVTTAGLSSKFIKL